MAAPRTTAPRTTTRRRPLRHGAALALLALALGCEGRAQGERALVEDARLQDARGDVALDSGRLDALDHEITSEDYRRWTMAQQALATVPGVSLPSRAQMHGFGDEDVERAEEALEADSAARRAIEGAGMSVEKFVLTSVALEQAMAAASGASYRDVPRANVALLQTSDEQFRRTWDARRVRMMDDAPGGGSRVERGRDDDRGVAKRKRGKHKDKDKGRGRRGRGGDSDSR